MKVWIVTILLGLCYVARSQEAVHNYGPLQLHESGQVGFHMDLINSAAFEENLGLVGFYTDTGRITVSGTFSPIFYDAEVAVEDSLVLETSIGINNNGNLITGDILTPRNAALISSNFYDNSFYTGESNVSKVDGYAAMTLKSEFVFPVGNTDRLRPLTIASAAINSMSKCAYFFEDPNNSKSLDAIFSTQKRATDYLSVSNKEFWRLESEVPSFVTLSWDGYSDIPSLGDYLSDLKVVGWNKKTRQWMDLGNTAVSGGLAFGTVTSALFVPDDYEILTIGGNDDALESYETIELANYFMTPNGDGANDLLILDGIEKSPGNSLQIFNRYGVLVYSKDNYRNEFIGQSNRNLVVQQQAGLASGIYFYIITMYDIRQKHQGYLYISN